MRILDEQLNVHAQEPQNSIQQQAQAPSINIEAIKQLIQNENDKVRQETKDEISKQIQNDKISLITIFGIFASITSFLTIEFQFLKTVNSLEKILGFSLILFALLLGFNIALDYIVKSRSDKDIVKPHIFFYTIIMLLFGLGIFFSYRGNEELSKENLIYQRFAQEFEDRLNIVYKEQKKQQMLLDNSYPVNTLYTD